MLIATGLLGAVTIYLVLGLVFAALFLTRGVSLVDPAAQGASIRFRLLILPGVVGLWPVMAAKWARARKDAA